MTNAAKTQTLSTTLLLPQAPKWDKWLTAYVYVTYVLKTTLDQVRIVFHGSEPMLAEFADIDAVRDYKSQGKGSALHVLVDTYPDLLKIPGMQRAVSLMNYNNKTGNLKNRFAHSFFDLINAAPMIEHNVPLTEHMMQIMELFWPVGELYFLACQQANRRGLREDLQVIDNPFCLDGFDALLEIVFSADGFTLHEQEARVLACRDNIVYWFEKKGVRIAKSKDRAANLAPAMAFKLRQAGAEQNTFVGHVINTDDKRVSGFYFNYNQGVVMLVIRQRTGRWAILTRGNADLSKLTDVLNAIEPGKWYHEQRYKSPMVLNGSESRKAEPSAITPTELVALITEHVRHRTRHQG